MERYGQYCPLSRAAEILGDRWTLLILRDLLVDGVSHFNALARGLPRLSRGLLSRRLQALQEVGILEAHTARRGQRQAYVLTPAGQALWPVLESLLVWGTAHAFDEPEADELDPVVLMWWIHRRIDPAKLPEQRVVVEFHFSEDAGRSYWLVLTRQDVSVCFSPPDFETDLWVNTSLRVMYQVWLGRLDYDEAVGRKALEVRSLPELERAFPSWFRWSAAADVVRAHFAQSA